VPGHSMKVKLHFCDGNEISTSERRPAPGATGGPTRGSIGVDRRNERSKDARRVRRERDQRRRAKGAKEGEGGEGMGRGGSVEKESPNTARSRRLTQPAAASQRIYPRAPLSPPPHVCLCLHFSPFLSLSLPPPSLSLCLSLLSIRLSSSPPVSGLKHSNMLLVSSSFYIGKRQ